MRDGGTHARPRPPPALRVAEAGVCEVRPRRLAEDGSDVLNYHVGGSMTSLNENKVKEYWGQVYADFQVMLENLPIEEDGSIFMPGDEVSATNNEHIWNGLPDEAKEAIGRLDEVLPKLYHGCHKVAFQSYQERMGIACS